MGTQEDRSATTADSLSYTISAVIATTQSWPEVEPCLDSLHAQVDTAGGEILLGDGSPLGIPPPARARYSRLRILHRPGASVFRLRAEAVEQSRGAIVAVSEDHCVVAADWCERILAAHCAHPDAAAIGGAVENGATASWIDWASFFLVNGASMPPLGVGGRRTIALQANVSYKRNALPPRAHVLGQMEWILNQDLRRGGGMLVSDDRILVTHVQSLGIGPTCRIHYDDGRTIASFRLERMGTVERWCRIAACPLMPPLLLARTLVQVLAKRRRIATVMASLPWMLVLTSCKAWGNLLGFLFGPGTSPEHIR
jgi:hypothetical protein